MPQFEPHGADNGTYEKKNDKIRNWQIDNLKPYKLTNACKKSMYTIKKKRMYVKTINRRAKNTLRGNRR